MNISLAAEKIIEIGPIAITNTMLVTWIAIILLSTLAYFATRNMTKVPGKLQNFFEFAIEALLGLIDNITADREKSKKFLPLVATIFLFIITCNWMGLIPGFETIGRFEFIQGKEVLVPFLRSPASDLNTTLALAIIAIVSVQIVGITSVGFFRYFKKFINFKGPIDFFVGIVESISEFAKIISFSFRLFGNVFAGGVLLAVVSSLIPFIIPIPFYGMELFVGAIQALVFAMLTTVFLQMATVAHDTEH
jgi:F-type H+-transporting ATPase subunit a